MEQTQETLAEQSSMWPQILIMEDEVSVGKGLQMVLTDEGYTADLAMTGKSALSSFDRKAFDLLIADLRLPDIDGMEVIKRVKHERPDTGVIVITGYATVPSAIEAMKLGAHDYLPKPFTEDEFISVVKEALALQEETWTVKPEDSPLPEAAVERVEPLPEDLRRLDEMMAEMKGAFSGNREDVIPMLQKVQRGLGYIPEIAMEKIARVARISPAAVYGIATFYEQFRSDPVGKHIIKVCRGTACHVKGAERIINNIEANYSLSPGQTSTDRMFTLETVACFGSCAIAPVVVVDSAVKGRMDASKMQAVLEHCRKEEDI